MLPNGLKIGFKNCLLDLRLMIKLVLEILSFLYEFSY